jgi:hypothetical protein
MASGVRQKTLVLGTRYRQQRSSDSTCRVYRACVGPNWKIAECRQSRPSILDFGQLCSHFVLGPQGEVLSSHTARYRRVGIHPVNWRKMTVCYSLNFQQVHVLSELILVVTVFADGWHLFRLFRPHNCTHVRSLSCSRAGYGLVFNVAPASPAQSEDLCTMGGGVWPGCTCPENRDPRRPSKFFMHIFLYSSSTSFPSGPHSRCHEISQF